MAGLEGTLTSNREIATGGTAVAGVVKLGVRVCFLAFKKLRGVVFSGMRLMSGKVFWQGFFRFG
jgi:hypothetical protein